MHNGSFNYCNLPPWVIASRHFNDNPQPLELQGVKEGNRFLFAKLATIKSQEERALVFNDYMSVKFQLHQWQDQTETARKSIKNSYLRYLRGWMMDSNSIEGAVLKRWVESRMGITPLISSCPDFRHSQRGIFRVLGGCHERKRPHQCHSVTT
jgi:NAD+--dinitrogen-reductase ADP-D-ribosyltransferase